MRDVANQMFFKARSNSFSKKGWLRSFTLATPFVEMIGSTDKPTSGDRIRQRITLGSSYPPTSLDEHCLLLLKPQGRVIDIRRRLVESREWRGRVASRPSP